MIHGILNVCLGPPIPSPSPGHPFVVARPEGSTESLALVKGSMATQPNRQLETFPNPYPQRDYTIRFRIPEFTCLCPKTGQPDFAVLNIAYVPDSQCVELKSLKLYIWSFRDAGGFHEAMTNRVLEDLWTATAPRFLRITADWNVRGGIDTQVVVEQRQPDWTPATRVDLP